MKILGVIPARYQSSRFPGKPLADIGGKSMIQRVYEQCQKSRALDDVVVATDDQRISDHVNAFGGQALMTSAAHQSGTDRCMEALTLAKISYDFVINIQGDEPFIDPALIDQLAGLLKEDIDLASLATTTQSLDAILDKDKTHVVFDKDQYALYFSRESIPHIKNINHQEWVAHNLHYIHLGIYAYRTDVLNQLTKLPKSSLEEAESLEQLRWLQNGYRIKLGLTDKVSHGVDKPEDIERLLALYAEHTSE